ncbi:MAG TPA: hypothetical protein VKX17_04205 [Planctomycetota bacterium]|nr:hypothetical protein [Planctomycetota bacterium]
MDQIKKNLFWIILGVIVVGALAAWLIYIPDADTAKSDLKTKTQALKTFNPIITPAHLTAAKEYAKKLETEKTQMVDLIKSWPRLHDVKYLESRFKDAPAERSQFENWMLKQRERLIKKLADANVQTTPDLINKILFAGAEVDDASKEIKKHRDYQLLVLLLVDDTIDVLCQRYGNVATSGFETDPKKNEPAATAPVSVVKFESFTFHTPEETAKLKDDAYKKALEKAGVKIEQHTGGAQDTLWKGIEMPVMTSSMEVEFVVHVSAVTTIENKLEANEHYFGEISGADMVRFASPFLVNAVSDTKVQADYKKAEFDPSKNTHYGEGPMRVDLTIDLKEIDLKKLELMEKPPAPPTPAHSGARPTNPPPAPNQ